MSAILRLTGHFSRASCESATSDPNAFKRAPEVPNGTSLADQDFGNSGVGIVRGPGQHNLDLAVERIFPVKEWSNFLLSHGVFQPDEYAPVRESEHHLGYRDPTMPSPTASSTYGRILGEAGGPHPRIIQFAAKYQF